MKQKILYIITTLLIFPYLFSANEIEKNAIIYIGYDSPGNKSIIHHDAEGNFDTNMGLTLGLSLQAQVNEYFNFGAGLEYQFDRTLESTSGKFNFIPLYVLIQLNLINSSQHKIVPFIKGKMGFNFFNGDKNYKGTLIQKGGVYFGLGGGFKIYDNIQLMTIYSIHNGTLHIFDICYSKFMFSIGFLID